jgi:hypothetical protein
VGPYVGQTVSYRMQCCGIFMACLCLQSQEVENEELSVEEAKERKIMKLLLKVSTGKPVFAQQKSKRGCA